MTKTIEVQNSFTSGEIGPKIQARGNLNEYQNSVSRLTNFNPLNSGGVRFREGIRHIREIDQDNMRLFPFMFSEEEVYYVLMNPSLGGGNVPNSKDWILIYDVEGNSYPPPGQENFVVELDIHGYHSTQKGDLLIITHSSGKMPPIVLSRTVDGTGAIVFEVNYYQQLSSNRDLLKEPYPALALFQGTLAGNEVLTGISNSEYTYEEIAELFLSPWRPGQAQAGFGNTARGSGSVAELSYQRFEEDTDTPTSWQTTTINASVENVLFYNDVDLTGQLPLYTIVEGIEKNANQLTGYVDTTVVNPVAVDNAIPSDIPIQSVFYMNHEHENQANSVVYDPMSNKSGWYIRVASPLPLDSFKINRILLSEDTPATQIIDFFVLAEFQREPYEFHVFDYRDEGGGDIGLRYNSTDRFKTAQEEFDTYGFVQYWHPTKPNIDFTPYPTVYFHTFMINVNSYVEVMHSCIAQSPDASQESYGRLFVDPDLPVGANIRYSHVREVTGSAVATGTFNFWLSDWGPKVGWPRTVTQFTNRIVFGGNIAYPDRVWNSAVDDIFRMHYFKMQTQLEGLPDITLDLASNDAFSFYPASNDVNIITWLASQDVLCIGTLGGEYVTSKVNQVYDPFNKQVRRQTSVGGEDVQSLVADNAVYFIGRDRRRVNEFTYYDENGQHRAIDVTLLNQNIIDHQAKRRGALQSDTKIQQVVWHDSRKILWVVTTVGELIGCALDTSNGVTGWFRYDLGRFADVKVNFVAVLPNLNRTSDDLYIYLSRRRSNEKDVRTEYDHYVEYLPQKYDKATIEYTETSPFYDDEACFLDGAIKKILDGTGGVLTTGGVIVEDS